MKLLRHARLLALDVRDTILRRRPPLTPSRRDVETIGGLDFHATAEHLARIAIDFGGLQPHDRFLDAGSGFGRVAVGLRSYLTHYEGFDVYRRGIEWSRRNIESLHPTFHFTHVDVLNRHYNAWGRIAPEQFEFPYPSNAFDFVFAASLFTHLLPLAGERYVREIARVLKPGGRCVASFFLLTAESRRVLHAVTPRFRLVEPYYAVQDPDDPEAAVAYDEVTVRHTFERLGLRVDEIRHGSWTCQRDGMSFQDFLRAVKS